MAISNKLSLQFFPSSLFLYVLSRVEYGHFGEFYFLLRFLIAFIHLVLSHCPEVLGHSHLFLEHLRHLLRQSLAFKCDQRVAAQLYRKLQQLFLEIRLPKDG